ncbi:MAG: serine--tRNA ligase [Candidatus Margulisbacteria bacterium]|nr:serine--tRNA ligase [Candidatus Margulisiibacteriota bacterium]
MLDPKIVREEYAHVKDAMNSRNYPLNFLEKYAQADQDWRQLQQEVDRLKNEQKLLTPKGKPDPEILETLKKKSDEIKEKNDTLLILEDAVKTAALYIPNIPKPETPLGKSEDDNQVVRMVGEIPAFSFTPKPHEEIGVTRGLLEFEKATQITGARFAIYKNNGARLERALINFMLDKQRENGYTEILPPVIVRSQSLQGTGQLPKFADDLFKLEGTDYWLSPTAEVQLTNLYQDSIIPEDELPIKITAYTPCFRKEAGSHGKDMKGLIRLHQFNKVELVQFETPENSDAGLATLLASAESVLQALKLPYRVVSLCTGDIGFSSAKTYDLEVWFPSQNNYREISSCSHFTDFQSRRAMIRYRRNADGKVAYLHTLNGSGVAVGRTFAAILENYQNQDGSINVPEVLQPYLRETLI